MVRIKEFIEKGIREFEEDRKEYPIEIAMNHWTYVELIKQMTEEKTTYLLVINIFGCRIVINNRLDFGKIELRGQWQSYG